MSHDDAAHKHLDGSDSFQRHLALARRLIQTQLVSQLILRHGVGVIDLVTEDEEGGLCEVFHGEEGVEFGFGFGETFVVFGVDEENDAGHFGKVITPQTAGCARG